MSYLSTYSNLDQINLLFRLNQYPYIESLMVVGDDSQAIFEFRGANSDGIINFHQWFNAEDIDLCENFRSTHEICQLANHVNDINTRKVPKQLVSTRSGDAVTLVGAATEQVFMDQVVADIKAKKVAPHDVAIMSRNRSELMKFKEYLDFAGIPSIIAASELLVEHADTKVIVNFFRFLMNPQESLYYAEFLKLQDPDEFNQNLYDFGAWFQRKKKAFLDAYFKLHTDSDKIDFIFGIMDDIAADNRVVSSLLNLLRGRNMRSIRSMSKFLDNMMLYNADYPIERPNVPVEAVTITTAHSSKGKEWKHCYLYLNKFKYPGTSDYCIKKNRADIEAERRLLFVAITRAKDTLMIGGATRSSIYSEIQDGI